MVVEDWPQQESDAYNPGISVFYGRPSPPKIHQMQNGQAYF